MKNDSARRIVSGIGMIIMSFFLGTLITGKATSESKQAVQQETADENGKSVIVEIIEVIGRVSNSKDTDFEEVLVKTNIGLEIIPLTADMVTTEVPRFVEILYHPDGKKEFQILLVRQ